MCSERVLRRENDLSSTVRKSRRQGHSTVRRFLLTEPSLFYAYAVPTSFYRLASDVKLPRSFFILPAAGAENNCLARMQHEWDLWLVSKEGVNSCPRPRTGSKAIVVEDQYSS